MEKKDVDQPDIKSVHSLLFGDNNEHITQAVREEARDIVSEVISESIHDRQKKDQSISKAIAPLMEDAITQSIENNKANLVSSLYPVVGSLVRKSVSVFFNSFLEKLNNLIEYSLTWKGIKWRIAAWKQGIPFAQYIIKQSFVFRVENVMLIHRETGTLLLDVATEHSECNDPELMSAMLTAINDFMADSFHHQDDVILDTIKTDELTLTIASGPKAILVAAISGIAPSDLQQHLQQTLEEIHDLLQSELQHYDGDNTGFANAEPHLRSCLLSELNTSEKQKKTPVWGIAIFVGLLIIVGAQLVVYWQQQQLVNQIANLTEPKGFKLHQAHWENAQLQLTVLRDPAAISVNHWLTQADIPVDNISINEVAFASLDREIISRKVADVLTSSEINFVLSPDGELQLSGYLSSPVTPEIFQQLSAIPGVSKINTQALSIAQQLNDKESNQLLLEQQIAKLALHAIYFDVDSAEISNDKQLQLQEIAKQINLINTLANKLTISVGIIISGYSDSVGNTAQNQSLSDERALNVQRSLIDYGVPDSLLHSVGAGEIPMTQLGGAARSVMFSVVKLPTIITKVKGAND